MTALLKLLSVSKLSIAFREEQTLKFELRRNTNITIQEAIVHIVNYTGEPTINTKPINLDDRTETYINLAIVRLLMDGESMKAKFFNAEAQGPKAALAIIDGADLVTESADIAAMVNRAMNQSQAPSGNLLVVRLMVEDQPAVAILKLDYQTTMSNDISFVDEEHLQILLSFNETTLPKSNQRPTAGAVIVKGQEYDMVAYEKIGRDSEGDIIEYFIKDALRSNRLIDNIDKTKMFHKAMEKWIRRNVRNQMNLAIGIREDLREVFRHQVDVCVQDIANDLIDDQEQCEKFIEALEIAGFDTEDKFELDKVFVEKVQKSRTTKTDTGIVIKGSPEIFDDPSKFEVKYNEDGTVNFIIKNVRNISQA